MKKILGMFCVLGTLHGATVFDSVIPEEARSAPTFKVFVEKGGAWAVLERANLIQELCPNNNDRYEFTRSFYQFVYEDLDKAVPWLPYRRPLSTPLKNLNDGILYTLVPFMKDCRPTPCISDISCRLRDWIPSPNLLEMLPALQRKTLYPWRITVPPCLQGPLEKAMQENPNANEWDLLTKTRLLKIE